jgi:hypothetical protein
LGCQQLPSKEENKQGANFHFLLLTGVESLTRQKWRN